MDKVKQILTVLKKHHFWILCALAAIVGLIVWNSSVGKLDAEFKRDSSAIDQTLSSLKQIQSPHPNDTWTEGFGKLTDAQRKQVAAAWNELYKQQKQKVYVWPQTLGKDFQDATAALDSNPEEKLSDKLRERYQNRVRREATRLAEIVDAPPPGDSAAGARSVDDAPEQGRHRVKWAQLADIQSSLDWDQAPSTQMIMYMQEELWVYEALCKVIKAVNEGSAGAHDASIIEIGEMAIAYSAAEEPSAGSKRIMRRKLAASEASPSGEAGKQKPDLRTRGKEDTLQGGGGGGEEGADPDAIWKSWRYVKDTGEPLMGGDLATASPEYNLMPFRLQLMMNPHDLDRLLVACRNSVLPIEVRQVRINAGGGTAASMSGTGKGSESGSGAGESHRRMEKVEVSGVVYLIKPFNPQAIGNTPAAESGGGEPAEGAASPSAGAPSAGEAAAGAAAPPTEQPPTGAAPAGG